MKLKRSLLCAAVLCAAFITSASASLSPEAAAAYQSVVNDLAGRYGSAHISKSAPTEGMYYGLACARLIDFDGDGAPELYCAYGVSSQHSIRQVLYAYDNGLIDLGIPSEVSNFGTDVSPSTLLYTGGGKAYLVDGQETMNGGDVNYFTKQGSGMVSALTYVAHTAAEQPAYRLNGETVSEEELQKALDDLTAGMTAEDYSYWSDSAEGLDPTDTISDTLNELRAAASTSAIPSAQRVRIDGEERVIPAYVIEETNYFKLRDLAMVLNGTDKQFAVGWDGPNQLVSMTTGRRYAAQGGELAGLPAGTVEAERAASALALDGKRFAPTAYVIGEGYHYYKLRDLAEALGVGVSWDAAAKTVVLTTK